MAATAETTETPQQTETLLESIASICVVIVAYFFVSAFVFQNFEIPSASMEKTLLIGDHLLVDRVTFAPPTHWMPLVHYREIQRGDIIVFLKPGEPDMFLVKRAIGIPGDRIHLQDGILYLNGVAQHEPQISMPSEDGDANHAFQPYRDDFPAVPPSEGYDITAQWTNDLPNHLQGGDLVVPPGKIFAMGDNRIESLDGRFWGFVPRENIVGRPLFNYWSFETPSDQIEKTSVSDRVAFMFHIAIHFFDQTRWKRTFHVTR